MALNIDSRITKTVVVMLIIVCMMGSCILDAYAAPILAILEAPAFIAVVKGLIAAGLVFGASYGIQNMSTIVNDYWSKQTEAIKNEWVHYGVGAITLSLTVWNSLRSYVQGFQKEGNVGVMQTNTAIQYKLLNGTTITLPPVPTRLSNTLFAPTHVIVGSKNGFNVWAIYTSKGYTYASYNRTTEELTIYPDANSGSMYCYLDEATQQWVEGTTCYIGAGNRSWTIDKIKGDAYFLALPGQAYDAMKSTYDTYQVKFNTCPWFINKGTLSATVATGAMSTTFDYTHNQTGEKTIYVPTNVTSSNVATYEQSLLDSTYVDVAQETLPTTTPETPTIDYTNILDAIKALITSILTAINTLVDKVLNLPETLEEMLVNVGTVATTLTGAISTYLVDIKTGITSLVQGQQETEYDLKVYNIPDLLKLLVMILLAILVLFLSFLSMVILLRGVPADGSLIPTQAKTVIEWMKDYQVPGFNMSFMSILIGFGTIMFLIRFVKTLRGDLVRAGKEIDRARVRKG